MGVELPWRRRRGSADGSASEASPRSRSQRAEAHGASRIVQIIAETVRVGEVPYRLFPWPGPKRSLGPVDRRRPSALLRAGNTAVDFVGRASERRHLREWRDDPDLLRIRLLHGPGGQGKTRLALQLAQEWQADRWAVLAAEQRAAGPLIGTDQLLDADPPIVAEDGRSDPAGVLLVVDYAERWRTEHLLQLVAHLRAVAAPGLPVRVLLLARQAGFWWQSVGQTLQRDLGLAADRLELPALGDDADRRALYAAARDRFADLLDLPAARDTPPPPALDRHDDYRLVLAVHMAALAAVLSTEQPGRIERPPADPVEVSAYLLARERALWLALHRHRDDPVTATADAMGQLVYTATLTGPLRHADATRAVVRIGIDSAQAPGQLLKDHARCYPAPPPEAGRPLGAAPTTYLEPLHPDRLGEDYLALLTPGHGHEHPVDPWAEDALARLLADPDDDAWTRHALTTLIEASGRWPHLATGHLHPLLAARPDLALRAGGAALVSLAGQPHTDLHLLDSIASLIPERHVELDIAAAAIDERLLEFRLAAVDPPGRAVVLGRFANRLYHAGQPRRALAVNTQALETWRALAALDPAEHRASLSGSLHNQAVWLWGSGQRADGMACSEEAIALRRVLAVQDPDGFLGDLARSLDNHAFWLATTGQQHESLTLSTEALMLWQRLSATDRPRHLPDLARSLGNHGTLLSEAGHHEEAVQRCEQAVRAGRELMAADPLAHLPWLASSLLDHGVVLAAAGRHEEAVGAADEAVDMARRLVRTNRPGHLRLLAQTLGVRAERAAEGGRTADALAFSTEAVDAWRELVTTDRAMHLAGLARALTRRMPLLDPSAVDRLTDAAEVVALERELTTTDPERHTARLAAALYHRALALAGKGQRPEALRDVAEALGLWQEMPAEWDPSRSENLVLVLEQQADWLFDEGRHVHALECSDEVLPLRRALPTAGRPDRLAALAELLDKHASRLKDTPRIEERLACSAEAVAVFRRLAALDRAAHLPALARSLNNHATRMETTGDLPQALVFSAEAVALRTELDEADPVRHRPSLARSLSDRARWLSQANLTAESAQTYDRALALYRELSDQDPAHLPGLAQTLGNFAGLLYATGDLAVVDDVLMAAVSTYHDALRLDPMARFPDYVAVLNFLAEVRLEDGRVDAAVPVLVEALVQARSLPHPDREAAPAARLLSAAYAADPDTVRRVYHQVTGHDLRT